MYEMLASEYKMNARKAVRKIELLVAQYDMLDEKITKLEYDYELEVESDGAKSRKAKKLQKRLNDLNEDLADLRESEISASELKLKPSKSKVSAQPVQVSPAAAH